MDLLGGQGIQAQALARRLRGEGYRVDLVPINPRLPRTLQWAKRYRYVRTLANELCYLPTLRALAAADIVHVYSASYLSFLLGPAPALAAARALGKRIVLNYHSGEAEDHLGRWGLLVHPWLRLADELVVPSAFLRDVFARFGYRTRVIENIVETSGFRYRERPSLQPRLLSVRNLEPHYGVDTVIRAFGLIKRRYPDATLVIAGAGSEEQRLWRLAAALDLNGISFRGRFDPVEAPGLYDGADVFVNASVIDNQPVSVLEAFAAGIPVVSTAVGDIPAMLEAGRNGVLVPAGSPAALADAVADLVEAPDLGLQCSRRAREALERFSWGNVRDRWLAVYAGARG